MHKFNQVICADKTIKLWKISERERRVGDGAWNTRADESTAAGTTDSSITGGARCTPPSNATQLRVPRLVPMQLVVEVRANLVDNISIVLTQQASPRRVYANAHTYHINSISVNSDQETYLSADDLRINLWHLEITNQSFSEFLIFLLKLGE
jgi:serine/threonine-protein phosphatase 2A regulatory subunit B